MSSSDPYQPPHHGWVSQYYQQPPVQQVDRRYLQNHLLPQSYHAHPAPQPAYVQPYYGNTSPTPFVAELPAPLPPASPTVTSDEQLKKDELLAHKLQNLEVAEVRKRSSSAVSQQQRPVSMAPSSPHTHSPLLHQTSSISLRPHSVSLSSNNTPWSPGSFGPPPRVPSPSLLPEVVIAPRAVGLSNDLPIPVLLDRNTVSLPHLALSNPSSLSAYLEEHRQVPYPPTWRLTTVIATFYAYVGSKISPGSDWLFRQEGFTWRTIRPTEHAYNPAAPSYNFKCAYKGGSFRDPRFSWFMTIPEAATDPKKASKNKQKGWTYDLRLDLNNGMRKTEVLRHGRDKAILTTYVHAANYDSLRFIAPDGRPFMWVSSGRVSTVNGSRYDTLRHALFGATGQISDPLYGEIVADHTFWDGYIDENEIHMGVKCDGCQTKPIKGLRWKCKTCDHHDVCEECRRLAMSGGFGGSMQKSCVLSLVCLPDEALYIRSPAVDPALVVATLQVLKDWERHTLRDEKRTNIKGFMVSEEAAKKHDLGIMSYWKAGDWDKKNSANVKVGTMVKAESTMAAFENTTSALGGMIDAGFALAGHGTQGGAHAGDGGGSGGFSGGGGDGGGGGGGGGPG